MRYVALLRGINVGGNSKVAMSDLRDCFLQVGFTDVSTYINSGNVLFSTDESDSTVLVQMCESAIEERCGFAIVVTVISADELVDALDHAPSWWAVGDPKKVRSDALFVIPPTTASDVVAGLLQKKPSTVDKLVAYDRVVFWTISREHYGKSVVPKMIGTPLYQRVTMRGAATSKKLYALVNS